jgi:hypothetical protein
VVEGGEELAEPEAALLTNDLKGLIGKRKIH